MGVDEAMIVAGIGCRKGVSQVEVLVAIGVALAQHGIEAAALSALAVAEAKTHEPAIHAAARALGLTIAVIGRAELEHASERTLSHSARSLEATGAPSASEAAALAAIGDAAKLLGPRIAAGPVTCALASDGDIL
jgi:cobalt-precorrin 5A hydrolase